MRPVQSRTVGSRSYVRLQQHIGGVPVRGASLVLRVSEGNSVEGISSFLQPELSEPAGWKLDAEKAVRLALAAHGSSASNSPEAERLYLAADGSAVPTWRVLFRSANPAGDWEYIVSAVDGSVLARQDLRSRITSLGYAFPGNPVTSGREQVRLDNLVSDRLTRRRHVSATTHVAMAK